MNEYQNYIALSRYARWLEDEGRRETWPETVQRYIRFWEGRYPELLEKDDLGTQLYDSIRSLDVMPSMRALMTAGPALERDNVAGYNCAYVAVDDPVVFSEILYILMCGTGVGFSVERQYINELPEIPSEIHDTDTTIIVADSKLGWASAFKQLISLLYSGLAPKWDLGRIRGAGARLKTFGGRASGPQPLQSLFEFAVRTFKGARGRKLNSLECHDLICKIADIVVVGGVRRSALISLSNLTDKRMASAKLGRWWDDNPQRTLANNSVCYTEKPDIGIFLEEWKNLYDSKCGERGIFNRVACSKTVARNGRRDPGYDFGTNPCSEIILRSRQFCNLSEVVIRPRDTLDDLKRKVEYATILGTLQSTLTDFRFLGKRWKDNCEEERLLGVSLTGIMDHPILSRVSDKSRSILRELREHAIAVNKAWAAKLGITQSCAITCVKPSGTVSQLVDSSSGIHGRYAEYYIRRVRNDRKDPIAKMMMAAGFPWEPDPQHPDNVVIFAFPMMAPKNARLANEIPAIEQLDIWQMYADEWCEHKPSCTIYYTDDNFLSVGAWVYAHFDTVNGVSFLPYYENVYKEHAPPYLPCTEDEYIQALEQMPKSVDWHMLSNYEQEDNTTGLQEFACTGNSCEVV